MKRLLQNLGYRVESAGNGVHALLLLQKNSYDILIVGFDLQDINGDELIKNLKQKVPQAKIPKKILGIGCDWECRRLLESGASMCLEKPFGINLLIDNINSLVMDI